MHQYLQYPSSPRQLITGFACFVAVILFDTAFLQTQHDDTFQMQITFFSKCDSKSHTEQALQSVYLWSWGHYDI